MNKEAREKCPFCGGRAGLVSNHSGKLHTYFIYVKCEICGAQGRTYRSEEEPAAAGWNNAACIDALAAWNMRRGEE